MNKYLFIFIGICFCLTTCKKEVSLYTGTSNKGNGNLIIGDNANVLIKNYDITFTGSQDIDINGDNIPDFRITGTVWGSPNFGLHPLTTLLCLDTNSTICSTIYIDTTFKNTLSYFSSIQNSTVYMNVYYITSCARINSNDNTSMSDQFKVNIKEQGDILNKTDFFISDTSTLYTEKFTYGLNTTSSNDTSFVNYQTVDFTCNNAPSDKIYYIGFKIKNINSEKLGWLKMSISDGYKITLYETAIQK